jgi:hypothetical protein
MAKKQNTLFKKGDRVRFHIVIGKDTMGFVELNYFNKTGMVVQEDGRVPLIDWDDKTLCGPLYVQEDRLRRIF